MMEFPITELMDGQACSEFLVGVLSPKGLHCPAGHKVARGQAPHMSDRAPRVDYRCRRCGKVFNLIDRDAVEWDPLFVSPDSADFARLRPRSADIASGEGIEGGL